MFKCLSKKLCGTIFEIFSNLKLSGWVSHNKFSKLLVKYKKFSEKQILTKQGYGFNIKVVEHFWNFCKVCTDMLLIHGKSVWFISISFSS